MVATRKPWESEAQLRLIAKKHIEEKLPRVRIANELGYTRQNIADALKLAEAKGIVLKVVVPEERTGFLVNTRRDVQQGLGLDDVVLVAGREFVNQKVDPNSSTFLEDVQARICIETAGYIDYLLTNDDIIALSGGREFVRRMVRFLHPTKVLPNLQVVPTHGFTRPEAGSGTANLISLDFADAYGARHFWLPVPMMVETEKQVAQTRQLPLIRDVYGIIQEANIIVMSVWEQSYINILVERGVLDVSQADQLRELKPVAHIDLYFFDIEGNCINEQVNPPLFSLTGLEIPNLRHRLEKEEDLKVILFGGASRNMVDAIHGILQAKLANILITDHITGQLLLDRMSKG